MLITSAQNEMLAARAGFLLAEIDYLSAKCLPISSTRGHSSLSEATGEIITAHFMKIINEESSLQENSECATRRAHQGSFKENIFWIINFEFSNFLAEKLFPISFGRVLIISSTAFNLPDASTQSSKGNPKKPKEINSKQRLCVQWPSTVLCLADSRQTSWSND